MVGWYLCVFGPFVFSCFVLFDKYSAQTKKMHFDESYNLFYIDFFIVLLNCDEYTANIQQIHSQIHNQIRFVAYTIHSVSNLKRFLYSKDIFIPLKSKHFLMHCSAMNWIELHWYKTDCLPKRGTNTMEWRTKYAVNRNIEQKYHNKRTYGTYVRTHVCENCVCWKINNQLGYCIDIQEH